MTTAEEWRRVKAILADALALPPGERQGWLDERLAAEPVLAAEVRSLLAAHDAEGGRLEPPPAAPDALGPAATGVETGAGSGVGGGVLTPGVRLGAYRIVREIGRGGMGVVYLAERDDQSFERRVALKLIQHGAADPDLERRFLRERRILAGLDHPGIARLLDGGTTGDGRPYLIMEHVEGEPIDLYCRRRELDLEATLDLFLSICSAVDFAHRSLVVHRDLKPSNVLVDASGTAKLLDFGIATLLDDPPGEGGEPVAAAQTRTGLRAMTPEYASPEQIRGEPITVATDVYALGVMLYQLLAGRRPYELGDRGLSEIVRVVCEQDPPPPSAAVRAPVAAAGTTDGPALRSDASRPAEDGIRPERAEGVQSSASAEPIERAERPGRRQAPELAHRLRGDVDAIVMKALRKEPGERYRSAAELAADLGRHREGLPVEARRGSIAYRAGKLARRHRLAVSSAAAFVLLLVAFAITMTVQVARTGRALVRAEDEAAKASAVQAFLEETLDAADPQRQRNSGRQTTIVEALDRARVRLETAFVERPEIEAAVQHLVGKLYSNLGSYEDAEPLLRQALATRRLLRDEVDAERDDGTDADVAATLESLAALLGRTGRAAEAEPLLEEALMMRRRLGGGGSSLDVAKDLDLLAHVASARGDYAQAAELEREALELYRWALGERAPSVVHALATIAGFERADGDLAAAESALRRAVHILDGLPEAPLATRAELDMDLGELLEAQGRYEAAERKIRKGLEIYRRVYGDEHHWVAQGHVRLGTVLTRQRRWDEAEEHLRRGVAIVESVLEPDHPDIAISLNNFAFMLAERGDLAPASSTFERVLAMQRRTVPDHPVVGVTLRSLGLLELRRGRPAESRGLLEEALSIHRRHHGENHPRTARSRLALGRALGELGDGRRAVELQREALAVLESTNEGASADSAGAEGQRPDHPQVAEARAALARSLVAMGRRDEAEDLLRRALPVLEEVHGPDDHRVREARETLAAVRGERRQ